MSEATDRYGRDYDDPEYGNCGIEKGRGNSGTRSGRYAKFGKALEAASSYRRKREAENQVDAAMGKNKDDEKNTQGFKIAPDATVVEGYRDPGFSVTQEGSAGFGGLIGTVAGAALGGPLGIGAMQGAQLGSKVGSYF